MSGQADEYDEFGQLITEERVHGSGSEYESDQSGIDVEAPGADDDAGWEDETDEENGQSALVAKTNGLELDATRIFGAGVEVVHHVMDTQDVKEPLVKPVPSVPEQQPSLPESNQSDTKYLREILKTPALVRNVALIGHMHHGKTSVMEYLLRHSGATVQEGSTTNLLSPIERQRQLTLKTRAVCTLVESSQPKSYAVNLLDTPGHTDFLDEALNGVRLADGAMLVIDAVEGLNECTIRLLREAVSSQKKIMLFINKIDRLVLELRLPPSSAASRLHSIVSEVAEYSDLDRSQVIYASTLLGTAFTPQSMSKLYEKYEWEPVTTDDLESTNNFCRYVLEPFYKLIGTTILGKAEPLKALLEAVNIRLPKKAFSLDPRVLVVEVLGRFYEDRTWTCVWDTVVKCTNPPKSTGTELVAEVIGYSPTLSLVRIHDGVLERGMRVIRSDKVSIIENIWLPGFGANTSVKMLGAGSLGIVSGISNLISQSGFISTAFTYEEPQRHDYLTEPVIKIGLKPIRPSDTESLRDALGELCHVYTRLKVDASDYGELLLWGNGELYLDCALYDLRNTYAKSIEFRCSDPTVSFMETVSRQSRIMCDVNVPNREDSVTVIASPLSKSVTTIFDTHPGPLKPVLLDEKWSQLDIASVWSYANGNVLTNDTIDDSEELESLKQAFIDGFKWAIMDGPLCEEKLRAVHFKIAEVNLTGSSSLTSAQIAPIVRKACYAAMLLAGPKLLEPWYQIVVTGPIAVGRVVYKMLAQRRGRVTSDEPILGTNLYTVRGELPVIDSFGLESDLRMGSEDQAQVSYLFCGWRPVPGDPLDATKQTKRLEMSHGDALARDFLMKSRRRIGLTAAPDLESYVDVETVEGLSSVA